MIELGRTGIKMSRLGQGTGVHGGERQSDQTRMGFAKLVDLMQHAYDRGIRFFDLADLYGTHVYFREALKSMERDKLAILTKVWWRYDGPEDQTSRPERRQMARTTHGALPARARRPTTSTSCCCTASCSPAGTSTCSRTWKC